MNELVRAENKSISSDGETFFNIVWFEHAQRVATMLTKSDLVPNHFRNNVSNCIVAMELASRLRINLYMLMQNMYVIYGRPGLESKLIIALINQSGRFEPIEFVHENEGDGDKWSCHIETKELKTKKKVIGPKVSIKMAKDEGWHGKTGSKWKTLPGLMLEYRAASFFCNTRCPEVKIGLPSVDELRDVQDAVGETVYDNQTVIEIESESDQPISMEVDKTEKIDDPF